MDDLVTRFAMEPYITPIPQESSYEYTPKNTLDTLFVNLMKKSDQIMDENDLLQKLDFVDQNLPQIYGLQSDKLSLPIPNDTDKNSISLFKFKLINPTIHINSLCPVPNIEIMSLQELLEHCVDNCIAVNRAAWAVQTYIKKTNEDIDLTETFKRLLIRDDKKASILQKFNYSHYAKFAYALYMKNLLRHEDIILSLMDQLPPSFMAIFKNEILPTYSILLNFLTKSKNRVEYKSLFANELQITRSQLVQLGLNLHYSEYVKDLQTEETEERIRMLSDTLCPSRLNYSSHYRNLIFGSFPFIEPNVIEETMSGIMKYATPDQRQELAMTMCSSVLWFSTKKEAVSATVAFLIKKLVPNFEYHEFFHLLFEKSSMIENFRYLFLEFQLQKVFDYTNFLHYIKINGLLKNQNISAIIISNLPSMIQDKYVLRQISSMMDYLFPGNNFDQEMRSLGSDLVENVDKIAELPYVFRFQIILFLIGQAKHDFGTLCSVLQKIDALSLITVLFNKSKPSKFTVFDYSFIEKTIPCFIAHNLLDSLAATALPPDNPNYKISELLSRFWKECEDNNVSTCLSKYKGQLPTKKQTSKNINVSTTNLQNFIFNNSHLCSLHIFDLFFSVRTENDFGKVFTQFLKDLLSFPLLTDEMLFDFFVNFCESQSVSKGTDQFIKCFMQTIICNQDLVEKEDSNSRQVITDFLTLLFKNNFIHPSFYLQLILSPRNRANFSTNEHLINLFFNIIEDNPNSFPVDLILTENVVAYLTDQELYKSLLTRLRQFPTPIITESLRNTLTKEPPLPISAAYFSLLPIGLQAYEFNDIFNYYAKNVDRTTSTFWTLWLRYKVYYNSGIPVTPNQVDKQQIQEHINKLWACFYQLILLTDYDMNNPEAREKLQIYLNCWTLLCADPQDQFTQFVSLKTAKNIHETLSMKKPLIKPTQIDYLHPIINNCSEAILVQICDDFCKYSFPESDQTSEENVILMNIASYIFATFANRFMKTKMQSTAIVKSMADKLLFWLMSLTNDNYRQTNLFVLDVFNFIVTKTAEMEIEQNRDFHDHILKSLEQFPSNARQYILVNMLMQSFVKVQDPLYFNFTIPHQDNNSGPFGFDNESLTSFNDMTPFELGNDSLDWF